MGISNKNINTAGEQRNFYFVTNYCSHPIHFLYIQYFVKYLILILSFPCMI